MNKIHGACNCGAIALEIEPSTIVKVVNCHCNLCRKMNGAVFATYVVTKESGFEMISGQDRISSHKVSQNASKYFCRTCGTPIYNSNPTQYPGLKILYLGTLENAEEISIDANIFCDTQLAWVREIAELPSFKQAMNSEGYI